MDGTTTMLGVIIPRTSYLSNINLPIDGLAHSAGKCLIWLCMQITACSGDVYVIKKHLSKRTWSLIWGAILMLFAFIPSKQLWLDTMCFSDCLKILYLKDRMAVILFASAQCLSCYWLSTIVFLSIRLRERQVYKFELKT